MKPLYTIGMGKRSIAALISTLKKYGIQHLYDIRSQPYSQYNPDFNRESLSRCLPAAGVCYAYVGDSLGGFPKDEFVLTAGKVDYRKLARLPEFQTALESLVAELEAAKSIVIFCSEGRPQECHRSKCIGLELSKWQVPVLHIDVDDTVKDQDAVIRSLDGGQTTLFAPVYSSRRKWSDARDDR